MNHARLPNPRLQRTRMRSPLSRKPLGPTLTSGSEGGMSER